MLGVCLFQTNVRQEINTKSKKCNELFFDMGGFHHANTPHATPLSQNLSITLCRNNKNSPFSVEQSNIKANQNPMFQPDVAQVYL